MSCRQWLQFGTCDQGGQTGGSLWVQNFFPRLCSVFWILSWLEINYTSFSRRPPHISWAPKTWDWIWRDQRTCLHGPCSSKGQGETTKSNDQLAKPERFLRHEIEKGPRVVLWWMRMQAYLMKRHSWSVVEINEFSLDKNSTFAGSKTIINI